VFPEQILGQKEVFLDPTYILFLQVFHPLGHLLEGYKPSTRVIEGLQKDLTYSLFFDSFSIASFPINSFSIALSINNKQHPKVLFLSKTLPSQSKSV
jgi:hypothetical protein